MIPRLRAMSRRLRYHGQAGEQAETAHPRRDVTQAKPRTSRNALAWSSRITGSGATVMRSVTHRSRLAWAARPEFRALVIFLAATWLIKWLVPTVAAILAVVYGLAFLVVLVSVLRVGKLAIVEIGARLLLLLALFYALIVTVVGINVVGVILGVPLALLVPRVWPHYLRVVRPRAPAEEVDEEFPGVAWLRGAEWAAPVQSTRTGWRRELTLPAGVPARQFADTRAAAMASVLGCPPDAVELRPGKDAAHVVVLVHLDDATIRTRPTPLRTLDRFDFAGGVPIGQDRAGEDVTLHLLEKHLLVAGETGSGKSNLVSVVISAAALDPDCQLWLLDGKGADLPAWEPRAARYVGADVEQAGAVLDKLQQMMAARYAALTAEGRRKAEPGDGHGLIVAVVDELAAYLLATRKDATEAFRRRLLDLLQRGRAAGVIVVATTQHPSASMISSDLRSGFTYRLAMRMSSRAGSQMILGPGVEADASRLDPDRRGLGWAILGGAPVLFRADLLDDRDLAAIQRRTARHAPAYEPHAPPAAPTGPTYPDGTPVPADIAPLWAALSQADEALSIRELQALGRFGARQSIVDKLNRLTAAGHVERVDGRPPQTPHRYTIRREPHLRVVS